MHTLDIGGDATGSDTWSDSTVTDSTGYDKNVNDTGGEVNIYTPVGRQLQEKLDTLLKEYILFTREPGVRLTMLLPNNRIYSGVAGISDISKHKQIDRKSAFRSGSTTKTVVATVVLQLVDEGRLSLDQKVTDLFPEYTKWQGITIRQLLSMRSGIPDYVAEQGLWLKALGHPDRQFTPKELVDYVKDKPLTFQPGKGCLYSETNYVLLGMIIEKVTGNSVASEIRKRIVVPLMLDHTYLETGNENDPNLVHGYIRPQQAFLMLGLPSSMIGMIPEKYFIRDDLVDSTKLFPTSMVWTAGALVTTSDDTARFIRALMEGRLLSKNMMKQMMTMDKCNILGQKTDYGLGLIGYDTAIGKAYGHGGMTYGYTSSMEYFPDKDIAITHLHNSMPEQGWLLDLSALWTVLFSGDAPTPLCEDPGQLPADKTNTMIDFRFKGTINDGQNKQPMPGIGSDFLLDSGKHHDLYGIFSVAKLTKDQYSTRVEFSSYGPAIDDSSNLSAMYLSVDVNLLKNIPNTGTLSFKGRPPYGIAGLIQRIWMNKTSGEPAKVCVFAVLDESKTSALHICDSKAFQAKIGSQIKVFGQVPVTTDEAKIKEYLRPLNIPVCSCVNQNGKWTPCEDQSGN